MHNHPRRKYTLTAKALAACRANLVKARAVPHSIRYRSTPRRRAACRANLLKAHAVLRVRGDRLPGYGTCFRHGLYAVSLERTLALAGERREDYDAHLALFLRAFAPQGRRLETLTGAVARCTWRLLRALRGQARWELCSLERRLGEAARLRRGELEGAFARATPLDRDHMLVDELQLILRSADEVPERRRLLHQRLERLLRLDVREREGEERARDFSMYVTPGRRDQQPWERVPLAMDNPLLRPSYVARALKRGPLRVESTKRWGWWPGDEPRPRQASLLGGEDEFAPEYDYEKALNYELAGRRGQVPPWDASAEGRARFVELFSAAFREPKITSMAAVPTPAAELQAAGEACWERLGFYAQRAEEEATRLREVLEEACRRRESGEPFKASALAARVLVACAHDLEFLDQPWDLELRLWRSLHAFFRARYGRTPRRFEYLSWPRERHEPKPRRADYWQQHWKRWEMGLAGEEEPQDEQPWPPPHIKLGYWGRRFGLSPEAPDL